MERKVRKKVKKERKAQVQDENQCWKPQIPLLPLPSTLDSQVSSFNLSLVIFYLSFRITISLSTAEPSPKRFLQGKLLNSASMSSGCEARKALVHSGPISRSIISLKVFDILRRSLEHLLWASFRLREMNKSWLYCAPFRLASQLNAM